MIPKIIHYCWFGGKDKPKEVLRCITSWKKYCPDYQIKEWNETNFNIHSCRYTEEAYQNKKWAFVSDVARVHALCTEGGIYMDTDVEVIRPLNELLSYKGFLGFEGTQWIATNIIGAEKENIILTQFLKAYQHKSFVQQDGSLDLTTNVEELTALLTQKYALKLNGKRQIAGDFEIFPTDHFSPYDYITGKLNSTYNTYTIHWFSQTWIPRNPWKKKIMQWYHRLLGIKMK